MQDVHLLGGGIIPETDAKELKKQGVVAEVFGPGTDTREIVKYIEALFDKTDQAENK
jgi:methylmalonyl-CoA mutase C-terminal domain/subunit